MFTLEQAQQLTARVQQIHIPSGANIHMYTNKIASFVDMVELISVYTTLGKDTTILKNKTYDNMMSMFKYIDKEYNRQYYNK